MSHQLVGIRMSAIGMVSLGELEIGTRELMRSRQLHIDPEPAKEHNRIFQMQTVSPEAGHAADPSLSYKCTEHAPFQKISAVPMSAT